MDMKSTQTHNTDKSKCCFPADSMTGGETINEGMYDPPFTPCRFVFIRVYRDFAKFRKVHTL